LKDKHNDLGTSRSNSHTTPRAKKNRRIYEKRQVTDKPLFPFDDISIFRDAAERARFIESTFTLCSYDLSEEYGVAPVEIQKWKKDCREMGLSVGEGGFPISVSEDCDEYLLVRGNPILIMGDAEIPEHDAEMFGMVMDIARKFNVKTLIINGDFIAMDCFSRHNKTTVSKLDFQRELDPALESLRVFLQQFEQIIYITGNHEKRLSYALDGHITLTLFLRGLEGVAYSEYDYCIVENAGEQFYVCHPSNYSRTPCALPSKIASIKLKHVISGHTHHLSKGYDVSGKFFVVESGHCRDRHKTRYKATTANTFPEWNSGFVFLLNGVPHPIDRKSYDLWSQLKLPKDFIR